MDERPSQTNQVIASPEPDGIERESVRSPLVRLVSKYPLECIAATLGIIILIVLSIMFTSFLDLLKVIVSWPVATVIIALCFGYAFKEIIPDWVRSSIIRLSVPGGPQLEIGQPSAPGPEKSDAAVQQLAGVKSRVTELEKQQEMGKSEIPADVLDTIRILYKMALHWRFMYLALFLVPDTKYVLWFLSAAPVPITANNYEISIAHRVYDSSQRKIILRVLSEVGFVETFEQDKLHVTEPGLAFLRVLAKHQAVSGMVLPGTHAAAAGLVEG